MKKKCLTSYVTVILTALVSGNLFSQQVSHPEAAYSEPQGFVTHEWGTFTSLHRSDGKPLSGLEKEEEHLPDFTYSLCHCWQIHKGWGSGKSIIKNVTIKMETPVLYFYNPSYYEKAITVFVNFKNGSISQWYPGAKSAEYEKQLIDGISQIPVIDFSIPRTGFITWNANIMSWIDNSAYTNPPQQETEQWLAPRATRSNRLKIKNMISTWDPITHNYVYSDQIEKFLFYRGIANFAEPINVSFNQQHNLVLSNSGKDSLAYVLVYERKKDGTSLIWWSGKLKPESQRMVQHTDTTKKDVQTEMERFVTELIKAGLYEDEARAMLATWKKSYFEHEGIKVFWIVPPAFTDTILPLQIFPQPDRIKRVMVGRSEILSPEFEQDLAAINDTNAFNSLYANDRFELAYKELLSSGIPNAWTDYNEPSPEDKGNSQGIQQNTSDSKLVTLSPNPSKSKLSVNIQDNQSESIEIKIISSTGEVLEQFKDCKTGTSTIDIEKYTNGDYFLTVIFGNTKIISKKFIKTND